MTENELIVAGIRCSKTSQMDNELSGGVLAEQESYEDKIDDMLDLCTCGATETGFDRLRDILHKASSDDKYWTEIDGSTHIVLWYLARNNFIEYGSSVLGSWITDRGKVLLDLLDKWHESDERQSDD